MNEQLEFLKLIARRLDAAGFPYMVTGSVAMALYTVPRMTRDVDLVIEYEPKDAERLAGLFRDDCYVDVESIREAAIREDMFNIIHNEWILKADFIARKDEDYRRLEFERRRLITVEGTPISIVSPEDLVLSKLYWARDSESALQMRDVRQLIQLLPQIDRNYVEEWSDRLGVRALLDRAEQK